MIRNLKARLAKLEQSHQGRRRAHEDWLEIMDAQPALAPREQADYDAEREREMIEEYGSLGAAADALDAKAAQTRDPVDSLIASVTREQARIGAIHAVT